MFPILARIRIPQFDPHTLCPIWMVDGSMVNTGSRFVVASSGVFTSVVHYVYICIERERVIHSECEHVHVLPHLRKVASGQITES